MSDEWQPFGLTDEEQADHAVLVEGVPAWLLEPLVEWLSSQLTSSDWVDVSRVLQVQSVTRVSVGVSAGDVQHGHDLRERLRRLSPEHMLRVVDYVVGTLPGVSSAMPIMRLDRVLELGRSKWQVGERMGRRGLVARVPEGVQTAVEATIASSGAAGSVLARAWSHVHGLEPNDSGAYSDAVRAVEIAAIAVVQPNHTEATLGTVLGQMKADGEWRLPLREHVEAPGPELLLAMGRTLWYGHRDRHGRADYTDVTHAEARAAVVLAATLVDWFSSGAVARRAP